MPPLHWILDRDGVLNCMPNSRWLTRAEDWKWLPGALRALRLIRRQAAVISVATNQSCVGRGVVDETSIRRIHARMLREAVSERAYIDAVFTCPHSPDARCSCRKPEPGMLLAAMDRANIPETRTVFVGDSHTDMMAAYAAGIRPILVLTGNGRSTEAALSRSSIRPAVFRDLFAAAREYGKNHG